MLRKVALFDALATRLREMLVDVTVLQRIAHEIPRRFAYAVLVIALTTAGCAVRSPLTPDAPMPERSPATGLATISGWVYANVSWADPPVPNALIEVHAADGWTTTTVSDLNGFYKVFVRPGNVSITTSKEGLETKTCQVRLLTHTVLNFFLAPAY